jgi:hypothetical protein
MQLTLSGCLIPTAGWRKLATVGTSLTRNQQLNRVHLLLSLPQQQQQQRNSTIIMLKTGLKAIAKFAMVHNNAGASAIFKLFTARPQLLEKRLRRPSAATTTAAAALSPELQKRHRLEDTYHT